MRASRKVQQCELADDPGTQHGRTRTKERDNSSSRISRIQTDFTDPLRARSRLHAPTSPEELSLWTTSESSSRANSTGVPSQKHRPGSLRAEAYSKRSNW